MRVSGAVGDFGHIAGRGSMDQRGIFEFLAGRRLAVVATVDPSGAPEAALIGYAFDAELGIVFDSSARSRKVANLRSQAKVALVIGWDDETSVQIEGVAYEPHGAVLARAKEVYFAAWPDGRAREAWPDITDLVIKPRWMRYASYAGDGEIVELCL